MAAVLDADIGAALSGQLPDFEAGVAGGRVEGDVGAAGAGYRTPQLEGVDGDDRMSACEEGELHDHQPDRPHSKDGHGVAQADMAVANGAQCEIGRVEADRGLPGQAVGKPPNRLRPAVLLAERRV